MDLDFDVLAERRGSTTSSLDELIRQRKDGEDQKSRKSVEERVEEVMAERKRRAEAEERMKEEEERRRSEEREQAI